LYEKIIEDTKESAKLAGELRLVKTELMKFKGILIPRAVMERFERERSNSKQRGKKDRNQNWFDFYQGFPDFREALDRSMEKEKVENWGTKSVAEKADGCGVLGETVYNLLSSNVHVNELGDVCIFKKRYLSDEQIAFMEAVCETIHVKSDVIDDKDVF